MTICPWGIASGGNGEDGVNAYGAKHVWHADLQGQYPERIAITSSTARLKHAFSVQISSSMHSVCT